MVIYPRCPFTGRMRDLTNLKTAVCQLIPEAGCPEKNADTVCGMLGDRDAELFVFPEMFLSGYGFPDAALRERTERALETISEKCAELGKAVCTGSPRWENGSVYNSAFFISPEGIRCYDKIHPAEFGVYSEKGFARGMRPVIWDYRGIRIGICICYDIFFPEIFRWCSASGSSVNICCSASGTVSVPFFEKILPARALENTTYMIFANNAGIQSGIGMAGLSRVVDPFGETVSECGTGECVTEAEIDLGHLEDCRKKRPHLRDYLGGNWKMQDCQRCGGNFRIVKSIKCNEQFSQSEAEVVQPGKARAWKARGNFPSGVQISPSALLMTAAA